MAAALHWLFSDALFSPASETTTTGGEDEAKGDAAHETETFSACVRETGPHPGEWHEYTTLLRLIHADPTNRFVLKLGHLSELETQDTPSNEELEFIGTVASHTQGQGQLPRGQPAFTFSGGHTDDDSIAAAGVRVGNAVAGRAYKLICSHVCTCVHEQKHTSTCTRQFLLTLDNGKPRITDCGPGPSIFDKPFPQRLDGR